MLLFLAFNMQLDSTIVCRSHGYDYIIKNIPCGYNYYLVSTGSCSTFIFDYGDSCQIYVSTSHEYSPNMQNILSTQREEKALFRINWYLNMYEYKEFILSSDNDSTATSFLDTIIIYGNHSMRDFLSLGANPIDLSGVSPEGRYWRDVITPEGYCYGYINVAGALKTEFDRAVSSIIRTFQNDELKEQIYTDQ